MKNSTSVTVTKRRIRLAVTTLRRTAEACDRNEPIDVSGDREEAVVITRPLPSSEHSAEQSSDTRSAGNGLSSENRRKEENNE